MAENTAIEWCDATLNLWWGCTKVSDGCKNCYAETLSNRYKKNNWGPNGVRQEVKSWRTTLAKISKRAKAEGRRPRVFVQSMSDLFEGPETMGGVNSENWKIVTRLRHEFRDAAIAHPHIDFPCLTKRPQRVKDLVPLGWFEDWPENVWIGTSVEDQKTADERIPHLIRIPASVRFLSCEPLLGPVDLSCIGASDELSGCADDDPFRLGFINWVITGGESGPNRRTCDLEWMRSLRDQCKLAGVPFFGKQWDKVRPLPDDLMIREFPKTGAVNG